MIAERPFRHVSTFMLTTGLHRAKELRDNGAREVVAYQVELIQRQRDRLAREILFTFPPRDDGIADEVMTPYDIIRRQFEAIAIREGLHL